MTRGEQRRKALKLLAPSLARRDECLRDIEYALERVSSQAVNAFKVFSSKEGKAGLQRYANAWRRLRAAYQSLDPRIRPWFSIAETAQVNGQPTHADREIAKIEALLDRPSPSSRASQHKLAVAAAHDLLGWWGHEATTTRRGKWARLAGILAGDQTVDLFDLLRAFKRSPSPTVEKVRGKDSVLYRVRR